MEQPKTTSCKTEANLLIAIDEDSCDKEVSEITSRCRTAIEDSGGGSEDRNSSLLCEKDEESRTSGLASGSSQSSGCVSCTNLQNEYSSYKNAIECNLGILKEKIVTTDELIKNYHKKCQENGKLLKKVEDLTEKLKKCYNETGALRVQLEKAKQANEPLKKAAARFEIEKNYSDHQALELKKKLRSTKAQLEDLQLSAMVIDKKSTTIETGSKKLERENEALNNRLAAKTKELEKLKGSLKEVRAAKRKSEQGERNANRQLEKITGKLTKSQERVVNLKDTSKKSPQKKRKPKKTAPKKTDVYEKEWRKGPTLRSSKSKSKQEESEINSESEESEEGVRSDDETTDDNTDDQEVAAIFNTTNDKFTQDFLKDFTIPSPPLSPIPPSPAPGRSKVGHLTKGSTHRGETVDVDTDICESKDYDNSKQAIPDINISEEHLSSDEESEPENQRSLIAENARRRYLSDSGIAESNEYSERIEFGKRRSQSLNNLSFELDQAFASDIETKHLPGTVELNHEKDQIMEFEDEVRPNKYATHVSDTFERSYSVCSSSSDDAESRGDSQILGSISSDDDLDNNFDDNSSDSNDDHDNDRGDANVDDCNRAFTDFNVESSFGFDAEVHTMDVSNDVDQTEISSDDLKGDTSVSVGNVPIDENLAFCESAEQIVIKNNELLGDSKCPDVPEASHKIVGDTLSEKTQNQQEHSLCTDLNISSIENQTASNSPSNKLPENEDTKIVEGAPSFSINEVVRTGVIIDTEDGERQLGSKSDDKLKFKLSDCQDEMKPNLKEQCESLVSDTSIKGMSVIEEANVHAIGDKVFDKDKNDALKIAQGSPELAKDRSPSKSFESKDNSELSKELNPEQSSALLLEVSDDTSTFPGKLSEVKIIAEVPKDIPGERPGEMQALKCLQSKQDVHETANSNQGRSLSTGDRTEQSEETASIEASNLQEFDKRKTDIASTNKNNSIISVDCSCSVSNPSMPVDESIGQCKSSEVTNSQRTSPSMRMEEEGQSLTVVDHVAQQGNDKVPEFEHIHSDLIGDISVTSIIRPPPGHDLQDNREHLSHKVHETPAKSRPAVSAEVKSASKVNETPAKSRPAISAEVKSASKVNETPAKSRPAVSAEVKSASKVNEKPAKSRPAISAEVKSASKVNEKPAKSRPAISAEVKSTSKVNETPAKSRPAASAEVKSASKVNETPAKSRPAVSAEVKSPSKVNEKPAKSRPAISAEVKSPSKVDEKPAKSRPAISAEVKSASKVNEAPAKSGPAVSAVVKSASKVNETPAKSRPAVSGKVKSASKEEKQSQDSIMIFKEKDIGDRQRPAATYNNELLKNDARCRDRSREVPSCNRLVEGVIDKEKSNDQEMVLVVVNIEKETSSATVAASPPTQDKDTSVICSEDNRSVQLLEPNIECLITRSHGSFARPRDDKSTENEGSVSSVTRQVTAVNEIPCFASASSYSAAYFQPIVQESPTINVPTLFASSDNISEEFSNELIIDTILSQETSIYNTLSPLPPTPPRHRLTPLLSPLPVTPLPDIVSPLLSPPEFSSLPTFRESKVDGSASESINVAKPRAVLPTTSMRMLDFNSRGRCQSPAEAKFDDENHVDNQFASGNTTSLTTVKANSRETEGIVNECENEASGSREPLPKIETLLKIFDRTDGSRDRDEQFSPMNCTEGDEVGSPVEHGQFGKINEHSFVIDKENIDRLLVSASYKNIEQSNCQISTKAPKSKSRVKKGKRSIEDNVNEQCLEGGALTSNDHNIEKKSPTKSNSKKRKALTIPDESPKRSLRKRDENGNVVKDDEPRRSRRLRGDDGVTTPKNKDTSAISKSASKERSPVKTSQRTGEKCKTTTEDDIVHAVTSNRTSKGEGSSSKQLPEWTRGLRCKRKSEAESEFKIKCLKSDIEETKTHLVIRSPNKQSSSKGACVPRESSTNQTNTNAKETKNDPSKNLKQNVEILPPHKEKDFDFRTEKVASPGEELIPSTTRQNCEVDNSSRKPGIESETTAAGSCSVSSNPHGNFKNATTPTSNSVTVTDTEESSKCGSKDMLTLSKESAGNLVKSPNSFITSNCQTTKKASNIGFRNSCRKTVLLSVEEIPHVKGILKGSDCTEKCKTTEKTSNKQPGISCGNTTTSSDKASNRNSKKQAQTKPSLNANSQKVAEDSVTTKPLSGRSLKQSQVEYAQQCLESLKNISSPKEVVQNFSMFKNISSASSIVSAIITYLKVNSEENMPNVYRRLGCVVTPENSDTTNVTTENSETMNVTKENSETTNVATKNCKTINVTTESCKATNLREGVHNVERVLVDNSEPDDVCEKFTKRPELTKLEQMILTVVAECAKVPHLGAVIKVLFNLLPKAILNESQLAEDKLLSLCRVYTALCRGKGEIERFKDFFVQYVCDTKHAKNLASVLITSYSIWPKFFSVAKDSQGTNADYVKENPVVNSIQVIAAWIASENGQIMQEKALRMIFGSAVDGEDAIEKLCDCLLECLNDAEIDTGDNFKDEKQFLGSHANDVIQSLELISLQKGWEWCNDYLIADRLWGIFRNWSKQLTSNNVTMEDKVTDATIASAIRLIGHVCQIGIKDRYEDFAIIIKMCAGILTRSSLCSKISLPVQIAAAHTLLDISSTDLNTISLSLNSWLEKAVADVPETLQRKIKTLKVPEEF